MNATSLDQDRLTELGRALGCTTGCRQPRASRPLPVSRTARCSSEPGQSNSAQRAARAGRKAPDRESALPESCYFSGPLSDLGPAPPPHVRVALSWGWMDREASELAERGRADIIRYMQMKARIARRGRKAAHGSKVARKAAA